MIYISSTHRHFNIKYTFYMIMIISACVVDSTYVYIDATQMAISVFKISWMTLFILRFGQILCETVIYQRCFRKLLWMLYFIYLHFFSVKGWQWIPSIGRTHTKQKKYPVPVVFKSIDARSFIKEILKDPNWTLATSWTAFIVNATSFFLFVCLLLA